MGHILWDLDLLTNEITDRWQTYKNPYELETPTQNTHNVVLTSIQHFFDCYGRWMDVKATSCAR